MLVSASAIAAETPPSLTTPDKIETRIGALEFKDGAPSKATLEKAYDQIDFTHAYDADGTTTVYFGPKRPDGVKRGNWIQTMPNKGWFLIPASLEPARTVLYQKVAP